jgi:hypothetical protein
MTVSLADLCERAGGISELELRTELFHSGLGVGHGLGWEAKARALCDSIRQQKAAAISSAGHPATAAGGVSNHSSQWSGLAASPADRGQRNADL